MPNHIHMIVVIDKPINDNSNIDIFENPVENLVVVVVETHGRASLRQRQQRQQRCNYEHKYGNDQPKMPQRKPKSISSFIAGFKSKTINAIDDYIDANKLRIAKFNKKNPLWQPNYYDHIIRNEESYNKIKNNIIHNPQNWGKDENNKNL